jgi:hypothetical protein
LVPQRRVGCNASAAARLRTTVRSRRSAHACPHHNSALGEAAAVKQR